VSCDNTSPVPAALKLRGTSSRQFPQNSFSFEFRKSTDIEDGDKGNLCGIGGIDNKLEDWVLTQQWSDVSVMRGSIANSIWQVLAGNTRWTLAHELVEVVINGENHGVYLGIEKIKRKTTKGTSYEIKKNAGVIFEIGGNDKCGAMPGTIEMKEPDCDELSDLQAATGISLPALVRNIGHIVQEGSYDAIEEVLDTSSFADMVIVMELLHSKDAYRRSMYLYSTNLTSDKIHAGPVWDFDRSAGSPLWVQNSKYIRPKNTLVLDSEYNWGEQQWFGHNWFAELSHRQEFIDLVKQRWALKKYTIMDEIQSIFPKAVRLGPAMVNHERRFQLLGNCFTSAPFRKKDCVHATHVEEVARLQGWLLDRYMFLDRKGFGQMTIRRTTYSFHENLRRWNVFFSLTGAALLVVLVLGITGVCQIYSHRKFVPAKVHSTTSRASVESRALLYQLSTHQWE
jgi:hypothetical protein